MEWSNEMVITLIDFYHERPVLWDCRLKEFKDRNKRWDALMEIAANFGVEKDEIDRKIKNLVCHFSRELKKEKGGLKSGAGSEEVYKSKWFCFERLLFLKDRNRPREITDMQAEKTSEDVESTQETVSNIEQTEEPSAKKRNNVFRTPTAHPSGSQTNRHSSATEEALSIMKDIQGRAPLKDQFMAFGEQVGMRIRDFPSQHAKSIVKHLISNILFEAEMGRYDNPNSFPSHYVQPTSVYNIPHFATPPFAFPAVHESFPSSSQFPQQPWYSGRMPASSVCPRMTSPTTSESDSLDSILTKI